MNANVELHFKVRPDNNILQRSVQQNSQPSFGVRGLRVHFSAHRFFEYSSSEQIQTLFHKINEFAEAGNFGVVIDQSLGSFKSFLNSDTAIDEGYATGLPNEIIYLYRDAIFGLPRLVELQQQGFEVVSWDTLAVQFSNFIPKHAWVELEKNIYPIEIPKPDFQKDLDLILLDLPSRNLSMLPNGLGYVHNAIKKTGIRHVVYDIDIVGYHRYHMNRIFNLGSEPVLPSGKVLPKDPWQAEHYDIWADPEMSEFMHPMIQDIVDQVCEAKPKIVGFSIQQCNQSLTEFVAKIIKSKCPSTQIVVGGFSCYNPNIGFKAFPLADYMCIGESDLVVGELMYRLSRGENIKDMPGVLSKHDEPFRLFVPAPMENDLDKLEDPRYEWFPLEIYRNWDGYQLTPVIASRGCRWSRCTFCAERFYWRIRDPKKFVDELEYLVSQGCYLFMFNESDLNGAPEVVLEICNEIIRRKLKIRLTAQLRIHKKSDKAFFEKLAAAGFVSLRFGIDAFSENTLRLQKKGYTKDTVRQNLKDCFEAGIFSEVNWVIGVPGETEEDCEEGVEFILENKQFIGRIANINPLILVNGSVYWIDPEAHGIKFNGNREEIFNENERTVPSGKWYSVDPYIDADVRKKRFEKIIVSLIDGGFTLGPWALKIYEEVKNNRDASRTSGTGIR
ncbi:B12-binding domain-containing radical SAM protein [Alphaproteobacteria bacterium]|nr:B12-binding domain-containing radical SAM protein [Alphaproteobacteria bacterium]